MKDYQSKKIDIPHDEYMQVLWFIRGYYRREAEASAIIDQSPQPPDGMPKGNMTGDPVASKAIKRDKMIEKNKIVDEAIKAVPEPYRAAVWNNIIFRTPYPGFADKSTFSRYRVAFISAVWKSI